MKEDLLQFVWQYRLYGSVILETTEGEPLEIISPGILNRDAGPDFSGARIKWRGNIWAGNVEVHINSSDWFVHGHEKDSAYTNIILHVVYENDKKFEAPFPVVELKNLIPENIVQNYNRLMLSMKWIPAEEEIGSIEDSVMIPWLERMLVQRLMEKVKMVDEVLKLNKNNWQETFYQVLARNFGFRINALPFEMLSRSLPEKILARHKNNLTQLEALLFGQSSLLPADSGDEYVQLLQREYKHLKNKFQLVSIEPHLWKFMRMRPPNFPTVRIAQFATLVFKSSHLLSHILENFYYNKLLDFFEVAASGYWDEHFVFGKSSPSNKKVLGVETIHNIMINTVAPVVFAYGKAHNDDRLCEKVIKLLEKIPAEDNAVIRKFADAGVKASHASQSQALLHLKKNYCDEKRCLECAIGYKILRGTI